MLVNKFVIERDGQVYEIGEGSETSATEALLALIGNDVEACYVSTSGKLNVVFVDEATLTIEPASKYEAWEVDGPDIVMIGLPGGGASVTRLTVE